ncbi:MAG: L-seryl-tRNA(Sec) selenium transferase [Dehalococcoidales bacterium]|nr:L-seryl-tRNA(Sec) selenium transferase [Dehalococcoidales bacterium]
MNFKNIPSVNEILLSNEISILKIKRNILKKIINNNLETFREDHSKRSSNSKAEVKNIIIKKILSNIHDYKQNELTAVINGTGVILHTNLGRAPINQTTSSKIAENLSNYIDLEIDIKSKKRNSRINNISKLLTLITGAEDATVFNNNALALIICLGSLGKNKEILVSRSESVEIGGGFRIPEIIKMSGLKIIDVGTTNKTYIDDYEENITSKTAGILKVHKSNYKIKGFTSEVSIRELKLLGNKVNIPVIHDLGSGSLIDTTEMGLPYEPTVIDSVKDGANIRLFSGDKLLGGPQAGIVIGDKKYLEKINKYPMARAARIDKLNLNILNETLNTYLYEDLDEKIPVWNLIKTDQKNLLLRAERILENIPNKYFKIGKNIKSTIGGGTFPETFIDSIGIIMIDEKILNKFEKYLLSLEKPIIGRLEKNTLMLDLRTIFPEYDNYLITSINSYFV